MTQPFAPLCNRISYTAQPTWLGRLRDLMTTFHLTRPARDRSYRVTMRFQGRVMREPLTIRWADDEHPTCAFVLGHWLEVAEAVNPANEIDYNWWLIGQGLDASTEASQIYHENLAFLARLQQLLGAEYPTFANAVKDQAGSDLSLLLEERESERQAETPLLPGVSRYNLEDDHQPYWRS